jgi:FAD/FMN-containing dehydrogenase
MIAAAPIHELRETYNGLIGADHVLHDRDALALMSQDVYSRACLEAGLIVAPASTAELSACVRAAAKAGAAVIARGAGMSYTGGYLPTEAGAVIIDMRRMNRIIEINPRDMWVRVEAGVTWAALYDALKEIGLRTPFWGPLSGLRSTIGAGLSQHNALLGAGAYGPSAESVIALAVVLADGAILDTAAGAPFRHYGPDLAGMFLGDCGALGVKAEAVLRLIKAPAAEAFASFAFATREDCAAAMAEFSRNGVGAEVFGFDPNLQRVRMQRASLAEDIRMLANVVKGGKSLFSGMREAAKIAVAGRDFINEDEYSVHLTAEGRSAAAVEAEIAEARRIARSANGREVENTIPKVLRATPFTPLNNIIGPDGERWTPVHGIVSHTAAPEAWRQVDAYFLSMKDAFQREGVSTGCLLTTISTNGFLIEPVFYWRSALDLIHRATIDEAVLSRVTAHPRNDRATALVAEARCKVVEIFASFGAAHFQIGKTYPYRAALSAEAFALIDAIKSTLDPQRRMNPGSLGLE